jgi:hypothetical protein
VEREAHDAGRVGVILHVEVPGLQIGSVAVLFCSKGYEQGQDIRSRELRSIRESGSPWIRYRRF